MELKLKLNEKQKLALKYLMDNITSDIGYWWWAWWWKSYLLSIWLWMMCNTYPWIRCFMWRKELKRLKQSTLISYFKFCEDYKIPQAQRWEFKQQDSEIVFSNWSRILLLDLANQPSDPLYTRFWSLELTCWAIDESNEVDEQCITILKTRIWRQMNREYWITPKLLQTFNPSKNHIYRKFYKPYKDWTLTQDTVFIPALVKDNPHIDPNYIIQLEKSDITTRERLLYWNFDYDDTPWKLFKSLEVFDLFTNQIQSEDNYYISVDVARLWKDNTVIMIWKWHEVIKIISYNWITTDETVNNIKQLEIEYRVRRSNIVIDSDWVWWWVVDQLRWCRWFVNNWTALHPRASKYDNSLKVNYSNLKTQCYFKLKHYAERWAMRINVDWVIRDMIVEELENIIIKDTMEEWKVALESKERLKERIWRSPDYADALMMRCYIDIFNESYEEENDWPWMITVDYQQRL